MLDSEGVLANRICECLAGPANTRHGVLFDEYEDPYCTYLSDLSDATRHIDIRPRHDFEMGSFRDLLSTSM
jgi:hypothetical protein